MANRHHHGRAVAQFCILAIMVALVAVACQFSFTQKEPTVTLPPPPQGPIQVLFVGNSLTFYNNGINYHLSGFTRTLQAGSVSQPNYSFKDHSQDEDTLQAIRNGPWNYVILQDQSQLPVINPSFSEYYAKALAQVVRDSGSEPMLMMTWERRDSLDQGVNTRNLANAYNALGETINALVIPVGLAFEQAYRTRPDLILDADDAHPTIYGTYLAACVLYGFLMHLSPVGLVYRDPAISAEDAAFLQQIAAEILVLEH
ncbi:MAG: DUF4886 domain-containing protein [Spirulina sp.]